MIDSILQFFHDLSSLISVTNPVGLVVVFGLVVFADIGIVIPFVIEPALFLIVYQAGPFSIPVLLFVLMLTLGRQGGTAILYWVSRFAWNQVERLIRRFFPKFTVRLNQRIEQFEKRLGKQQSIALAIARLTPGLLQVSTIASGILQIPFYNVMAGTFIAGIIYDGILVFLGGLAHYGLKGIDQKYSIFVALGAAVLMGLVSFIISRVRRKKE